MKVSIVISVYNEEEGLMGFYNSLIAEIKTMKYDFELVFVNDGSRDSSQAIIDDIIQNEVSNVSYMAIQFSRNYGHEAAMIAGIDNATGDAILCMDADGQHPPNKIPDFIKAYEDGYDVVLSERVQREDGSYISNLASKWFYTLINFISDINFKSNSSDFFLISRKVADNLKANFRDKNRFIRGFIQSLGYKTGYVQFVAPARMHGQSNYNLFSLMKLSFDAVFSFSNKPLRISIFFSIMFIIFTFIFGIYSLYKYVVASEVPSGYTTIVIFLSACFSFLFFTISIISLYFEKLLTELKDRPIYTIDKITKK